MLFRHLADDVQKVLFRHLLYCKDLRAAGPCWQTTLLVCLEVCG